MVPRWWPAPAKLNLFLHITGRRDDGYHLLQSAFQLLDYHDYLQFAVRDENVVRLRGGDSRVAPEHDLVVKAAKRLQTTYGCDCGVDIVLKKRIPVGAGLGGASSDAATTLVALNALWGLGLSTEELAAVGLELGADVPVFLRGASAWAEGVGEQLTPLILAECWYVVVYPNCAVATRDVFAEPALTRNSRPMKIADCIAATSGVLDSALSPLAFLHAARNDCEAVVRRRYPAVDEAFRWLSQRGQPRLTGTGASVFVPLSSAEEAERLVRAVPKQWQGFVARGVNHSPLQQVAQELTHNA